MIIFTIVSAIATAVIAFYAYQTKVSQDQFQEQLGDLYRGIIISTLLSSNSDSNQLQSFIGKFNQYYDGKTRIFGDKT
jgi:hypothetical protein